MESTSKKVFLTKEAQEELGLSKNYIVVSTKQKEDPALVQARAAEARQRKKDKKKLQKIRERKAKDKKLKDIMTSLEETAVDNTNFYDLLTSTSTMKKDKKKYEMAKQKLGIPDTAQEAKQKEKEKAKTAKKEEKLKEEEQVSRVRLLSQSDEEEHKEVVQVPQGPILLPPQPIEGYVPVPLVIDQMKELNDLLAELESDDEETIADKNSNKELMKINLLDKKPELIPVSRTEEIENARRDLPVFMHEREILESVENNLVTVVCGETGSGKSTQIPQILYEYGYTASTRKGMIGITQPRRVAATSLSKRISDEMNVKFGDEVGYQIRYDKKFVNQNTVIKLMTDGILLKELELDLLLDKYSVIIIDEAHERSINTDILISLLSRIVRLRLKRTMQERLATPKPKEFKCYPLRLVIMSATLRVDDFLENKRLFPSLRPRLIKVESRQYPVEVHFNKVTKEDYEEETFKKVCKIHKNLPSGGILVFLTGKKEIEYMVERLKLEFNKKKKVTKPETTIKTNDQIQEATKKKESTEEVKNVNDIESDEEMEEEVQPVYVLPLYSMLSPEQQLKVFQPPKEGHRFIVVSTNIAETSVTIPNIKYVVDCGREKQKVFDPQLRLSKFLITWVSKASADQRAGRAGRTGPGHCYRLFSSAVFNKMEQYAVPEILRTPIDQTILQLKALGINDLCKFPFVSSPNLAQVKAALRELCVLGALELIDKNRNIEDEFKQDLIQDKNEKLIDEQNTQLLSLNFNRDRTKITDLGFLLSTVPLAPKFAKMLIFGKKAKIVELAIITVASLTVQELFINPTIHMKDGQKFGDEDDLDSSEVDDPDLMTQIDIDRKLHKLKQKKREVKEKQKELRKEQLTLKFKIKEKWFSERGDIHTNVLAIGAYLQYHGQMLNKVKTGSITKKQMYDALFAFTKSLYLNKKSIDEVVNLCNQLQKIMNDLNPGSNIDVFSMSPPTGKEQTLLQQLILVGFPENIAKKKEVYNSVGVDVNLQKKRPAYECLFTHQTVYLHSDSNLDKPKFVCYKEIQQVLVRKKNDEEEGKQSIFL